MMSDLGWHCTILKIRTSLILPLQGLKKLWNRDQRFHFFHVPLFSPTCCNYCRMRSFLSGFPSSFHMHTANQEMLLWCVISFPQQTIFPWLAGWKPLSKMLDQHISSSLTEAAMYLVTWQLWGVSDRAAHKCVQHTVTVGGKKEEERTLDLGFHIKSSCRTKP